MNFLAIIPARGGSRELKNKNILKFDGKPLIYWTIKSAQQSKFIKDIIISTDSKKIAKICEKFNCKVPTLRPKKISSSNTLMLKVIKFELNKIKQKKKYDAVILLQPTSPLRTFKDIDRACKNFIRNKAYSLVSVSKLKHIYNPDTLFKKSNNFLIRVNKKKIIPIRQKKKRYYNANGAAIYITKMNKIEKFIIGGKISYLLMNEKSSVDIDSLYDLKLAELIKKNFKKL